LLKVLRNLRRCGYRVAQAAGNGENRTVHKLGRTQHDAGSLAAGTDTALTGRSVRSDRS
jgi:hypothetical protein